MEITFLVIFTLFLFFQTYGASGSNTMMMTSSNVTCIERERQSLLVFRQGLTGESNRLSTWTGVECCEWQGVGCDRRNGHVVKLDLRSPLSFIDDYTFNTSNWLKGKVSPSLLDLKHLSYLDLSMNKFLGQNIPEFFGCFKYLEYLNLSYSGFSGVVPPHLGNLSRLQYLDLNLNLLQRYDIPYEVSLMVKDDMRWVSLLWSLKHLDLSGITIGNHIDWFHPVNMLPSLLTLNLASCDINYIPSIKFINLTSLNSLDLSYNVINSTIPVWLSNLTGLMHLNLAANSFHGPVPADVKLCNLSVLDLSSNEFAGELSSLIGNMSSDCLHNSLKELNLYGNNLNGRIPNRIGEFKKLEDLDLSSNQLSGPIPPSLGQLSNLKALVLYSNQLSGSIPESIGQLSMLEGLDLSFNQLSGSIPESIGQLSMLERLSLWSNELSGSIPESIGQLSMLEGLDLSSNQLSGSIPESIGQLSMLEGLDLLFNQLSGSIPESIGQLSMLERLDLSSNQLSGSIPESIGQLSMLQGLYLSGNQLSGSIPESIGQLSMLEGLHLQMNQLSGSIPESIGQLSMLEGLSLSSNQLSGPIPPSLGQLSNLRVLSLDNNSLAGVVSEIHFTKLNNLTRLDLSGNSLTLNVSPHWIPPFIQLEVFGGSDCNMGPHFPNWLRTQTGLWILRLSNTSIREHQIPEWFENISSHLHQLDLSHNHIGGKLPTLNGSGLEIVNLGKNRFTGSVPAHLCELLNIQMLDLSNNNFSGHLPKCLGKLIQLRVMDLTNNTITGNVPNSLGSLSNLESLHLRNNKFEGNLPMALQNLKSLVTFDLGNNLLTGSIPSWIGKKLSKLRILNFQSNKFMGKIPLELCQNNALQHLNLANNNIVGIIPSCFYNLTGMINISSDNFQDKYIVNYYDENVEACIKGIQLKYTKTLRFLISLDLSSNKIAGEIPGVLMNLALLTNLNLSRNLLSGHIPTRIGNLKSMESLDFSMNKFSGRIPPSLASLNFLSYLNLSFNKLSGPIPDGNQLQTLGDPSAIYEGNNELCGPTLSRRCEGKNLSYTHVGGDEGKNDIEGLWFYAGIGPGFVIGFMGIIGSLYFKKEWRITYFEIIENLYTWFAVSLLVTLARIKRIFF